MKGIEATSEHNNEEKVVVETGSIGNIKECLKMRGPEWRLTTYGVSSKLLGTANGGLHRSIRSGSCKIRKEVLETTKVLNFLRADLGCLQDSE